MSQGEETKTLIQCDFDGTITVDDISFRLLDEFADGNWRELLEEYRVGKIPVGDFNTRAFAMVKADRKSMVDMVRHVVEIRQGFRELLEYSKKHSLRFVIVSNGLDFYIETILKDLGVNHAEVFAAQTQFDPAGMKVRYIGPDGNELLKGFKDAYTSLFIREGYRIIYIGNGLSDASPASLSWRTFATGELVDCCREMKMDCISFDDLHEVVDVLKSLKWQKSCNENTG